MKILLLGGSGLLGSALRHAAPAAVDLVAPPHAALDATDAAALDRALAHERPQWVISCAAFTAVDAAESHEAEAMRINAESVGALGRLAAAHGARVLLPSTDYVFDGPRDTPWREEDAPSPRSAYGRSKRAGEIALLASTSPALIVRTGWLYGRVGRSFPATMWARARARTPSRVVDDQLGAPTYADDLAGWCWTLIERGVTGTVHAVNAGEASWADVARHIYARAGFPEGVTAVSTAEYGAEAPRPAYGVLDCSRLDAVLAADLDSPRRHWRQAMDAYLDLRAQEEEE